MRSFRRLIGILLLAMWVMTGVPAVLGGPQESPGITTTGPQESPGTVPQAPSKLTDPSIDTTTGLIFSLILKVIP
ncbi:MAG: hypothetical protein QOJ64_3313 [Acidobacteriota bacterium]|jgi:hypothetical protein|nr:hypothetical protein [Acidobacteriota bacterium]